MQTEDSYILSEFKKRLRRSDSKQVVDLDDGFSHKFDFTLQRFEDILGDTNRAVPPNRWSYHRIGLTTKGGGDYLTGIYNFKARENTLIVIPSRVITSSKNWTLDTAGYFVLFNMNLFIQNNFPHKYIENKKILSGSYQPYVHLTEEQAARITSIFEAIITERSASDTVQNELLALKLAELVIVCEQYFTEHLHFEENLPTLDTIRQFSDLVEKYFTEQRNVKFYAEQLSMHPNYLNSLVKKHTGLTAKTSIQQRILLEAKYLLHSTDLSIKEISARLGFNDPNYFTAVFTQHESTSPGNYRSSFI